MSLDSRRSTRTARSFREFIFFLAQFAGMVLGIAFLLRGCK